MSRHIYRKRQLHRSISLGTAEAFQASSLVANKEIERGRHEFDGSIKAKQCPALPLSPTELRRSNNRWNNPTFPCINLDGSWLDLESEDEGKHLNSIHRRRKRSTSPTRDALSSLKDKLLSRRSSMYFRRQ